MTAALHGSACIECGEPATERAHIIPRSLGGTATVPLCGPCHGASHGMPRVQDIGHLTRLGLQRARASGKTLGRPRVMPDETVALIMRLRSEGLSLQKIADRLTADGVPTAHGGKRWYVNTIKRVVDREKA